MQLFKSLEVIGFDTYGTGPPGPTICLLDATHWQICSWFGDNIKNPLGLALSQDGRRLVAILGENKPLQVWDTVDQTLVDELEPQAITTVAFGSDSRYLFTGSTRFNTLCVWKLAE